MLISINNPIAQTWIFGVIFFAVLLFSARRRKITEWFPISLTTELKGLAIVMIVLSHIGYFLVNDHRFLWPLSVAAGVGVNLFLFLSGYGLAVGSQRAEMSPWQFYKKRFGKLFRPFWLVLIIILALDVFVLKMNYSWDFLVKAVVGIFTHADLYQDFNSPFWYFTFIIGYYLLFPWVFCRKRSWLSAIILYALGYGLVYYWSPAVLDNVIHLYRIHIIAFPLGVLAAWFVMKLPSAAVIAEKWSLGWRQAARWLVIAGLLAVFIYANVHSGVGQSPQREELMSILAVLAICLAFAFKRIEFRLFTLFGIYSYEIYLWHWPLMYRYDIFYSWLPAWLATILYLALFIGVGFLGQKVIGLLSRKKTIAGGEEKK